MFHVSFPIILPTSKIIICKNYKKKTYNNKVIFKKAKKEIINKIIFLSLNNISIIFFEKINKSKILYK